MVESARVAGGRPVLEYFGPNVQLPTVGRVGVWRDGWELVMFEGSVLPARCVRCGFDGGADTATTSAVRLRLGCLPGHMRWLAGFVFVALGFARRVQVEVHLCVRCRRWRERTFCGAGVLLVVGLVSCGMAVGRASLGWTAVGSAALLVAAWLFRRAGLLDACEVGRGLVRLTGAGAGYLTGLPIGGPPGVGLTSADLAARLTRVGAEEEEGRSGRGRRKRKKRRRRRRERGDAVVGDRETGRG